VFETVFGSKLFERFGAQILNEVIFYFQILGNIIYHFGSECWLSYVHFVHVLQSSLIMSIINTLFYSCVALLACDIFYTVIIKPR
jgi:hypothetical protein